MVARDLAVTYETVNAKGSRLQTILVVADTVSYQETLQAGLSREGYHVDVASSGAEALKFFAYEPPDLVLLDARLPDMSGTEVCRQMLRVAPVPIIMVSAHGNEGDIVEGLNLGAMDYITKPDRPRELVARVRSVLRREPALNPPLRPTAGSQPSEDTLEAGPVRVELSSRIVTRSGQRVHLSRREFDLLALLLSPPDHVRTRDELIGAVWSGRALADTRTLDTHIRRLRLKLEQDPIRPQFIVTVRGVGFRIEAQGEAERKAVRNVTV